MESELHRRIRERARLIWEREGRPEGAADRHWREAEQAIAEEEMQASVDDAAPLAPGGMDTATDPENIRPNPGIEAPIGAKVTGDGRTPKRSTAHRRGD